MDVEEGSEEAHSSRKTNTLHAHRLDHNSSKLPAFRFVDLNRPESGVSSFLTPSESASASLVTKQGTRSSRGDDFDLPTTVTPLSPYSPARRPSSSPAGSTVGAYLPLTSLPQKQQKQHRQTPSWSSRLQRLQDKRMHSSNGIETATGPPPALSTQRSSAADAPRTPTTSTTEWALAQQQLAYQTLTTATPSIDGVQNTEVPRTPRGPSKSLDESSSSRPLIPPIRSFRSSATRASLEMHAKTMYRYESQADDQVDDRDRTLRALEGFSDGERNNSHAMGHEAHTQVDPATEDLFLNIARDDPDNNANGETFIRSERRRSRIALASNRQSLTYASNSNRQSPARPMSRRGSDAQDPSVATSAEDHNRNQHTDRVPYQSFVRNGSSLSTHRYPPLSRSHPSTPRGETQFSTGGRRSSIPDSNASISSRSHAYRQSNLSYSTPRIYNSSPLVARQREVEDGFDTPRVPEGTESTVSTTAPSTVWDELDDLKSRIRKLELTGKLPPTSGAAISRASAERPPTATTTITTMSTSPKRGRGLSTSPVESNIGGQPISDAHPLLHSALAKSKPLVHPEVYKALEATASDALTIATMTGSLGQTGPISSTQSVIGGASTVVTDRQLRRKADGLCRSLTELCLALSEGRSEIAQAQHQESTNQALTRPMSRDRESVHGALDGPQRAGDGLARMKPSPRVPSRLEARRSSMLATSTLPTPRHPPSDAPTPTQSIVASRRTSVLLRNRRAGTEEPEEEESRFRAPSRAVTEIARTARNSPREYTSQQPLPEIRPPSIQSSLPLRRNYVSTNLNSSNSQDKPLPNPATTTSRRFLDRSTPERDMSNNNINNNNTINRLAEDRSHRGHGPVSALAYEGSGLGMARAKSLTKSRPRPQLRERIDTETSID